jgi:hypothetical protein
MPPTFEVANPISNPSYPFSDPFSPEKLKEIYEKANLKVLR